MRDVATIYNSADFAALRNMEYPISLFNVVRKRATGAATPKDAIAALQLSFKDGLAPVNIMESEEA